jgi:hypothetical protein
MPLDVSLCLSRPHSLGPRCHVLYPLICPFSTVALTTQNWLKTTDQSRHPVFTIRCPPSPKSPPPNPRAKSTTNPNRIPQKQFPRKKIHRRRFVQGTVLTSTTALAQVNMPAAAAPTSTLSPAQQKL